jgi:hypothetical protein
MSQDVIGSADADTLAAEYVLGTLDFEERSSAQSLCAQDEEFAAKVTVWERWLGELHLMVEPVEPEPEIWQRIRAKLPQIEQPQPVVPLAETEPLEARPQPEQEAKLSLAEPNQAQSEPAEPKVAEPKVAELIAAEPKAAESEPADHTRSDVEAVASARPRADQKAVASSSEAQLNFEAAIAAAIAPPMPSDAPLGVPDAPPPLSSDPPAAPQPAAESDIGVSAPAPAPAFSATVPEPPSSPAAPEPPFTAPAAPAPETKPDEKLRPPTRQLAFWRTAALLLALAVAAVTGLVALWKFLPDRVPAALRPLELMRLLGIDIAAPPRRPPPPPESHFDE